MITRRKYRRLQPRSCLAPLGISATWEPLPALHVAVCNEPRNHKGPHKLTLDGYTVVGPMTEYERLLAIRYGGLDST